MVISRKKIRVNANKLLTDFIYIEEERGSKRSEFFPVPFPRRHGE